MTNSQFCIQQRQQEQQRLKKLLIVGFAGSAALHGILAYALPRWSFETPETAEEPIEMILVDKPKPTPKPKPKAKSKPIVEPKPKPVTDYLMPVGYSALNGRSLLTKFTQRGEPPQRNFALLSPLVKPPEPVKERHRHLRHQ